MRAARRHKNSLVLGAACLMPRPSCAVFSIAKCQHKNREERAQMPKVRVAGFSVSLDGFSAGIEQSLSDPLGKRGTEIFQWYIHTRSCRSMHGQEGVSVGDIHDEFAHRAMDNFGAS